MESADTQNPVATKPKEEEEKSENAEGQRVTWSYSNYVEALEKDDIINRTNEDTFSCLSGECTYAFLCSLLCLQITKIR